MANIPKTRGSPAAEQEQTRRERAEPWEGYRWKCRAHTGTSEAAYFRQDRAIAAVSYVKRLRGMERILRRRV
ncbi:hypothetical protein CPLU01_07187 [Colletotrichum plurivorum]|uniref:Uncharacterized protein n=1 Tax=Colletotrichum plurivorum TaxID=2175906 RepID=A0A8H6KGN0_9PEZI|nr:hypothetical protein CPLU01_07187 [Colletotrichum plurivorum]